MLVTYTAPNRAHHYAYATAIARAGCLRAFVCGFSRFSPRAPLPAVGDKLLRADHLQNFFIASQKLHLPGAVCDELAHLSKIWMDWLSERPARESDVFLFYNGAGLRTARRIAAAGVSRVVEVVNCHVETQEEILQEEHRQFGLPFRGFHKREVARRVREYHEADAILCASEFVLRSFVEKGFSRERLFKVPYGFEPPPNADSAPPGGDVFRVLYVGQITVRKGLRYLIEAFRGLRHPRKELWIVGSRAPVTGLEDVSIPDGAKFCGVLKGEDLMRAYRSASVFVLPTLEDGFGLVMGEALSFGLPVLATVNSGAKDLFDDGVEGFHLPIREPAAIREKLQTLADDPARAIRMSVAAKERVRRLWGWDEVGRKLVETLQVIVNNRQK
jgi:glycosyltransferase involved in cell wall biosynthesis